jgi:DNA-binding NtrC family response regulator
MTIEAKRRIFVVDDEITIGQTLAIILNSAGYNASAFSDPFEALRAAEVRPPDVLLTDVMMPQWNGIDLGVQFKVLHPECKVLLFSGNAGTSKLLTEAKGKGHEFELLSKPLHPTDLLEALRAATE